MLLKCRERSVNQKQKRKVLAIRLNQQRCCRPIKRYPRGQMIVVVKVKQVAESPEGNGSGGELLRSAIVHL